MLIMDGYLPLTHAVGWAAASAPFVVNGYRQLRKASAADDRFVLATATAYSLVLLFQ